MKITVEFVGVCTHVRRPRWPPALGNWPLTVPHRVLLPKNPGMPPFPDDIPPHVPIITGIPDANYRGLLQPQDNGRFLIRGAALSISVPGPKEVGYDSTWSIIPQMQADGRPSVDADLCVLDRNREVHGVFDVDAGTFSACCGTQGAAAARLTIDGVSSAELIVRSIRTGTSIPPVALPDGSFITVLHRSTEPGSDDSDHFALHFVLAASLPADKPLGNSTKCGEPRCPADIDDLGPGCSNTDYP